MSSLNSLLLSVVFAYGHTTLSTQSGTVQRERRQKNPNSVVSFRTANRSIYLKKNLLKKGGLVCSGVIYSPNSACCLGINTLRAEKATTLGDKMEVGRGLEKRNMREKDGEVDQKGRNYEKKLTVLVEIEGEDRITMMELLKKVREDCGVVIGCRYKTPKEYELTMEEDKGKEKLLDGLRIKKSRVMAKEVDCMEMVVSFLGLPTYIQDEEILRKLSDWGVKAASRVKRRMWPGTDIADGTRFLKVKFNEEVKSLPYSTKFETLGGTEHFRVIHDRQVKVCRLCIQPGHIVRDCPSFRCFKCDKQGHYARECKEENCKLCNMRPGLCVCETPAEMSEENIVEREPGLYDLYEMDEEEESEEEEGATIGKEEGRDTWSGEERTGEWRAIENVSSQEEGVPRRRRRDREKKRKRGERNQERRSWSVKTEKGRQQKVMVRDRRLTAQKGKAKRYRRREEEERERYRRV